MRAFLSSVILVSLAAAVPASAESLKGADCLDTDWARSWSAVDDHTVLVDAGKRKYRIELKGICFELDMAIDLAFKEHRVCGYPGEYLIVRGERCDIGRIALIDDAAYRAATEHKPKHAPVKPEPAKQEPVKKTP